MPCPNVQLNSLGCEGSKMQDPPGEAAELSAIAEKMIAMNSTEEPGPLVPLN